MTDHIYHPPTLQQIFGDWMGTPQYLDHEEQQLPSAWATSCCSYELLWKNICLRFSQAIFIVSCFTTHMDTTEILESGVELKEFLQIIGNYESRFKQSISSISVLWPVSWLWLIASMRENHIIIPNNYYLIIVISY